jgi:hypothetical protein
MNIFFCPLGCYIFKTKAELKAHLEEHRIVNKVLRSMK